MRGAGWLPIVFIPTEYTVIQEKAKVVIIGEGGSNL